MRIPALRFGIDRDPAFACLLRLVLIQFVIVALLGLHPFTVLAPLVRMHPQLLFVRLWALHEILLMTAFAFRLVGVMGIVLAAATRDARVPRTLGIGRLVATRLGFFGMLTVLVRGAGTAHSFCVRMFLRHGSYRSC